MHYGNSPLSFGRLHDQELKLCLRTRSGAGTTTWHVVIGRAVAGVGGAGMTSLVSILIAGMRLFPPDKVPRLTHCHIDKVPLRDIAAWRGYVNVASTVGRSAGGPFGGYLADTIGWRW